MNKTVAVLIPTKDRRIFLERALKSVFSQTAKPDEIIIVNDGSIDDTKNYLDSIAGKYNNLKIIHRDKNGGVNTARNQGIKMSKSDWVMFLDDDDELFPNAVFLAKEKMKEIPDNFYLFSFNTLIKKDTENFIGGLQFRNNQFFYDPGYEEVMVKYRLKGDCKPVFRRSLFDTKEYLFPEAVNGFESIIIRKMARDDKKIRYYNEISTIMNLQTHFEHLSYSAPAKNPGAYFSLNKKDLRDHADFYHRNLDLLRKKYIEISKLAIRAYKIGSFLFYLFFASVLYARRFSKNIVRFFGMQRWVRLGIRYRIIFRLPKQDLNFSVPFFGYTYNGNLKDYIDRHVFYFGAYEREELLYLKRFIYHESIVLDIGANTGHHSLFFSSVAKRIYSFEPYKKPFNLFLKRIEDNDIKNIFPNEIGLGDKNTEAEFFAPQGENGGAGSFVESFARIKIGKLLIKNGDDFVAGLKEEKINLIKIDVEGMEINVLNGLKNTIRKDRPVMFVEMSSKSQSEIFKNYDWINNGYDLFIIDANNPFLFFFNKPGCKITKFEPKKRMENILFVPRV